MKNLEILTDQLIEQIIQCENNASLDKIKSDALGKEGFISLAMQGLKDLDQEQKKEHGALINKQKNLITECLEQRRNHLDNIALERKLAEEKLDLTLQYSTDRRGSIHPISQVTEELANIMATFGFEMKDGPEIESDYYNFTALNMDENHPARQMHDTFYIENCEHHLLRTHTSNVQIRSTEHITPPIKIFSIGRVYRCDYDATHTPMFHQMEGLYIDKNIHMGHLKYVIIELLKAFFEKDEVPIRMRPSFFPFTEPSVEVDVRYSVKDGEVMIGEGDKWLEILGCGMVHPNVLRNCNIDPEQYKGFAFGIGVERLAMLKYGINDLRTFFEGERRFAEQYNFNIFDIPSLIGGLSS